MSSIPATSIMGFQFESALRVAPTGLFLSVLEPQAPRTKRDLCVPPAPRDFKLESVLEFSRMTNSGRLPHRFSGGGANWGGGDSRLSIRYPTAEVGCPMALAVGERMGCGRPAPVHSLPHRCHEVPKGRRNVATGGARADRPERNPWTGQQSTNRPSGAAEHSGTPPTLKSGAAGRSIPTRRVAWSHPSG
jgi:hypothetical protein